MMRPAFRLAAAVAVVAGAALGVAFAARIFKRNPIHVRGVTKTELTEGLVLVEADLERGTAFGGHLVALYFDPKRVHPFLALNPALAALRSLELDALAVVNAGFFTKERRATGLLVSAGRTLSPFVARAGGAGSGVFVLEDGHPALLERDQIGKRTFENAALAIQAGPRIIEPDGRRGILSDDGARANRTVIGATTAGLVVVAIIVGPAGWPTGPTLFEAQHLLGARGIGATDRSLALRFALNLDGGPSTGLHVRAQGHAIDLPETAPVHSALALRVPR